MNASTFRCLAVAALIPILFGCSDDAKQAAPHLIVAGMAKLSGAKHGFFITNGQPTYHDWNAGSGNIVKPLDGADADTFYVFEQPKKSRALFARDDSHVFMASIEINDADAKSFQLVTPDGLYTKDANRVYFMGVPIVEAKPDTFEVLIYPFSQDATHAFIGAAPIPNIDRASWRPLRKGSTGDHWYRSTRETYPKKQESVYAAGWSRDANSFYYGRERVSGVDVATFEVLSDYYAMDKRRVYSRHFFDKLTAIKGADPATFVVHEDADELLSRGADAHDANSQYQDGKVVAPK